MWVFKPGSFLNSWPSCWRQKGYGLLFWCALSLLKHLFLHYLVDKQNSFGLAHHNLWCTQGPLLVYSDMFFHACTKPVFNASWLHPKLVFVCFDCGSNVANFKLGIMLENLQTWSMANACLLSLPLLKTGWQLFSGCCVSHDLMSTKCHSYNLRPPLYVRWITVHSAFLSKTKGIARWLMDTVHNWQCFFTAYLQNQGSMSYFRGKAEKPQAIGIVKWAWWAGKNDPRFGPTMWKDKSETNLQW